MQLQLQQQLDSLDRMSELYGRQADSITRPSRSTRVWCSASGRCQSFSSIDMFP